MQRERKQLIIIFGTAILLLGLIVNQVSWVYSSAKLQEEQFNDRVDLALHQIVASISHNKKICKKVTKCIKEEKKDCCSKSLKQEQSWEFINDIIRCKLEKYKIDLQYDFEITDIKTATGLEWKSRSYTQGLDEALKEAGISLHLHFPGKTWFITKQIKTTFISAILLIILISIAFIFTVRSYRREKQMASSIRDFINNMTHEFKTPIANIRFASNNLAKNDTIQGDTKLSKYASIVQDENERINKNVEEILQIAKAESNAKIDLQRLDLASFLLELTQKFNERNIKGNQIDTSIDTRPVYILANPHGLENAILNIYENAFKYNDANVLVSASIHQTGSDVKLIIQDNGIGVSSECLPILFDKFYRVSNQDQHDVKGFGLGLTYVKMILEKMNAKVKAEQNQPNGLKIVINFKKAK